MKHLALLLFLGGCVAAPVSTPDVVYKKRINIARADIIRAINRYEYFDEVAEALEKWDAYLNNLMNTDHQPTKSILAHYRPERNYHERSPITREGHLGSYIFIATPNTIFLF